MISRIEEFGEQKKEKRGSKKKKKKKQDQVEEIFYGEGDEMKDVEIFFFLYFHPTCFKLRAFVLCLFPLIQVCGGECSPSTLHCPWSVSMGEDERGVGGGMRNERKRLGLEGEKRCRIRKRRHMRNRMVTEEEKEEEEEEEGDMGTSCQH
jgi:hypothetical protein